MFSGVKKRFAVLSLALAVASLGVASAGERSGGSEIGEAKAREIALAHAGGGEVVMSKYKNKRYGDSFYVVMTVDGDHRTKMRIDAATGDVVDFEKKSINRGDRSPRNAADANGAAVSPDQARKIALERTGGGTVVKFETDRKRSGRVEYEVEIIKGDREYEMEIDGQTGEIRDYSEEMIDD